MRKSAENKNAEYVCINISEISVPKEIKERAICINRDVGEAPT